MIIEIVKSYKNKLKFYIKYSQNIDGYIEEDNLVGIYSKDIKEVLEIFRVIKHLPLELREKIIKKILFEEFKHIFIIEDVLNEIEFTINEY